MFNIFKVFLKSYQVTRAFRAKTNHPIAISTPQQLFSSLFCYTGVHSNLRYFNCQKYQKELLHFKQSSQTLLK